MNNKNNDIFDDTLTTNRRLYKDLMEWADIKNRINKAKIVFIEID